jgi:hypothetical protein
MTLSQAKAIIKANADKPILPGTREMEAIIMLASRCARNKS